MSNTGHRFTHQRTGEVRDTAPPGYPVDEFGAPLHVCRRCTLVMRGPAPIGNNGHCNGCVYGGIIAAIPITADDGLD